jgi:hypothetical protein
MNYREALKKTALFVAVSLIDRGLWRTTAIHAGELLVALVSIVGRVAAIAVYPLSVPVLAALIVAVDRANARERDRVAAELAAEFDELRKHTHPLWTAHTHHKPIELRTGNA